MTLALEAPHRIAGESLGAAAARWGFSSVVVALAFSGALWFASNLPAPEGALGDLNDAVMIDLEPMEAIEEAPPPAPEPTPEPPVEQPVAETPPPPPEPAVAPEPEPTPPPPEPVAEPPPPEPVPPPPEPVAEPPPPPPEPVVEPPPPEPPPPEPLPEPIPEPTPPPPEPVPELPQNDAAEAVLNAPVPAPKPVPPRPRVERKEPPRPKETRRAERREQPKPQPQRQASTAPASSAPAARNTASAPRATQATWARQVISRIRAQAPRTAGSAGLTARVSFSIDRSGRIISASVASSSGDSAFDREAVALVRRASPVPAPPEGVGSRVTPLTVPVRSR
ncbi:energy transducer TonB family protein [Aureimonas psammosilenae]|uniref:energy transducer TonB family protein n=1 Tax=Aureimonas psammosilenae TaxID=2495496 RepID=UPI0012608ABE|nr:TonB family protein [Aureimonas psammosilenae]